MTEAGHVEGQALKSNSPNLKSLDTHTHIQPAGKMRAALTSSGRKTLLFLRMQNMQWATVKPWDQL